jgi:hypothetical protein
MSKNEESPRSKKDWDASCWKILCVVELQEILVPEEWRVTLPGEKG